MPKEYTSPTQRAVDLVGRFLAPTTEPEVLDALAQKLLDRYSGTIEGVPNHHPKDVREGSVERAIKSLGGAAGSLIDRDQVYLEQYLHPDKDVLPPTQARPTHLRPYPGVPYREPEYMPAEEFDGKRAMANVQGLGNFQLDLPNPRLADVSGPPQPHEAPVHDLWDFDTAAPLYLNGDPRRLLEPGVKAALRHSGKPFAVYGARERKDANLPSPALERELLKRRRAGRK